LPLYNAERAMKQAFSFKSNERFLCAQL